jgi:ADP-heptose:LPS heptosyltransferase
MGKKVLIYRRGGLGDTLLTFPVAEIYKRKGFEVHFVGNSDYLTLGVSAGLLDRGFPDFPKTLGVYDEIVLFSFENFLKVPAKVVFPFPTERVHVLEHYLKNLGFLNEPFSEKLNIPLQRGWENRLVIHPGSGSKKKNAPVEFFVKLATLSEKILGLKPLVALGLAEEKMESFFKAFEIYRVENLVEFAEKLKGAGAFVGNDSGFSHLAGYLGVPSGVLFGPTDPEVWKPIGKRVRVFYKNLDCSPCFPSECKNPKGRVCLEFSPKEILKELKNTR